MSNMHLTLLLLALVALLVLSAFFSSAETGLMAINRYRLRHLARTGHRAAQRVSRLLQHPDRLLGLILLGNNFVNILASSLATVIALALFGEAGVPIAALLLTLLLLVFGEVTPKTLAALHPERIAYPASLILEPLLKLLHPVVKVVNVVAHSLLKPFGVIEDEANQAALSPAELRSVVLEASGMIPARHRSMLLGILDLEAVTVEDIMVPRNEIEGIDLEDDWSEILAEIKRSQYTRLLVYRGSIEQVVGFLHMRTVLGPLARQSGLTRGELEELIERPYYVPEGTQLHTQLLNFQQEQKRIGLVVDEYGDLQGLITLEDILEEIVGEFTTDPMALARRHIRPQADGSYLVDGSVAIRTLNRTLKWDLPTDGPKTLNGLITEYLETIPAPGTNLRLAGHPVEIVKISGNRIKTVVIRPPAPAAWSAATDGD